MTTDTVFQVGLGSLVALLAYVFKTKSEAHRQAELDIEGRCKERHAASVELFEQRRYDTEKVISDVARLEMRMIGTAGMLTKLESAIDANTCATQELQLTLSRINTVLAVGMKEQRRLAILARRHDRQIVKLESDFSSHERADAHDRIEAQA